MAGVQTVPRVLYRLRAKPDFLNPFKLFLPVQSLLQKYFHSLLTQITRISHAVPPCTEGRFAIVTDVGRGMRWTLMVPITNGTEADGEVVWS
jgi:hypothetical protein